MNISQNDANVVFFLLLIVMVTLTAFNGKMLLYPRYVRSPGSEGQEPSCFDARQVRHMHDML